MSSNALAPIIIKKKKIVKADGHHGGAWKVAYADFVTAMMAFFLLMWLLNATSEKQRKGLADYFSPTIPINNISAGGDGSMWGDSMFDDDALTKSGSYPSAQVPMEIQPVSGDKGAGLDSSASDSGAGQGAAASEKLLETLKARGGESMAALLKQRHVVTKVTDEGLVIEVVDLPGYPLFFGLTAQPTRHYMDTLEVIARVMDLASNRVAVNGHMAAQPLVARKNPVWDLSAARADATRQLLEADLQVSNRLHRVTGYADRKPVEKNPMSIRNNRIEIVLLRDGL